MAIEGLSIGEEPVEEHEQQPDDDAVAELLFETLKLYENGKLESAFAKCKMALQMNPNSTSARSLLGLIYEKKADIQLERGNKEDAEDYLRAAIRQIERVLEVNKDSDADREKLEALCAKVDDLSEYPVVKRPSLIRKEIESIKALPPALLAGVSTTLILIVFIFVLLVFRGGESGKAGRLETTPAPQQVVNGNQPSAQPSTYNGQQRPLQVQPGPSNLPPAWTYNPQANSAPQQSYAPLPQGSNQPPSQQAQQSSSHSPLPPLTPYPVEKPKQAANQQKPEQPHQPAPVPVKNPAEAARAAFMRGDYQSAAQLYEQAIASGEDTAEHNQKLGMCFYNLAKKDAAISRFQRAVQLYMEQKARGVDVEAADRAIDTCKLYIDDLSRR